MNNNGRTVLFISAMNDGVVEFQVNMTRYVYRVPPPYVKRIVRLANKSEWKALNLVKKRGSLINKYEVDDE